VNPSSLVVALSCLLLGPPEGPAPPPATRPANQAAAPSSKTGRGVSFDESIGASAATPIVTGYAAAVEDKRGRDREIPRQSQNLQLQLMPGARVNADAANGFELQTTLSQGWKLGGYGRARRSAAEAETDAVEAEARARALEQRFDAADAWIRLHSAELRLQMTEADLALARELVELYRIGLEQGVNTRLDLSEAEALEVAIEGELIALRGEVHELGLGLARAMGSGAGTPLSTRGDYPKPELPEEAELRRRFAALERLPAVQLRELQARAALAEAREAKAASAAVVQGGASVQLESSGELVLFGVLGAQIPVGDRNQRSRASAQVRAHKAEAEAEQLALELAATLATALHDLRHTRERVELLRGRSLPVLDRLIVAREAALDSGEGTRALVLAASHQRSIVARELAAAEAAHAWAEVQAWLYLEALSEAASAEETSR